MKNNIPIRIPWTSYGRIYEYILLVLVSLRIGIRISINPWKQTERGII